ncbi:hypothetical protein BH09BAC5_BH09BAC5_04320 [soil metagenome]
MREEIDLSTFFKMDRSVVGKNSPEEQEVQLKYWLTRPIEERYYAIEYLRAQWIELNNLPTSMDRTYFEYR